MDDLTPMDSEYREVPPEPAAQIPYYYGTGRQPQKQKSHLPLIVLVVVLVFAANLVTAGMLLWLRETPMDATLESEGHFFSFSIGGAQQSTSEAQQPIKNDSELNIQADGGDRLTAAQIYKQVQPSLAQITVGDTSATGVILTDDGYILTNASVLNENYVPEVMLSGGAQYRAQVIGSDGLTDLAVLKINAVGLTAAALGDAASLQTGDVVYALSYPFGSRMQATLTQGMISSVSSITLSGAQFQVLQTDAALAGEGSGGPIVNDSGQVVAIHVAHVGEYVSYDTVAEIGFALPVSHTDSIISQLMDYGYVRGRASLGVEIAELTDSQRRYWDLPEGVIVSAISTDSNAYRAGLRAGDVLVRIGDVEIKDAASYYDALNRVQAGERADIVIYRQGRYMAAEIIMNEETR